MPRRPHIAGHDHGASDDCGVRDRSAPEDVKFWHDHKGAGVNAVRT